MGEINLHKCFWSHDLTKMGPCPYKVKTLKKSLEPKSQWPWDFVCSFGNMGPTKFAQMILG